MPRKIVLNVVFGPSVDFTTTTSPRLFGSDGECCCLCSRYRRMSRV